MAYLLFELKKVIKNKLTPISISILIIILGVVLFMNLHAEPKFTLQAGAKKEIVYYETENTKLKQELLQQKRIVMFIKKLNMPLKVTKKLPIKIIKYKKPLKPVNGILLIHLCGKKRKMKKSI